MCKGREASAVFAPCVVNCPTIPDHQQRPDGRTEGERDAGTPPHAMQIFVTTFTGRIIVLEVEPCELVASVKSKIHMHENIPPAQQRLLYRAKPLEDDRDLVDYGVRKEATLHLMLRARGGCGNLGMLHLDDRNAVPKPAPTCSRPAHCFSPAAVALLRRRW